MPGDPLSEQWAGDLPDLPDEDLAAMGALFRLFNEEYDQPEEWDAHRRATLGRLPDRDIRCDVVVVERDRAYRSTELHWERIELPGEPSCPPGGWTLARPLGRPWSSGRQWEEAHAAPPEVHDVGDDVEQRWQRTGRQSAAAAVGEIAPLVAAEPSPALHESPSLPTWNGAR